MTTDYRILLAGVTAATLITAGCVSPTTPKSATEPWIPPNSAQKTDEVWKALQAHTNDFSHPVPLAMATDMALQNNPASSKAWHDARAAAALVKQVRGYFMPTVTATASASREKTTADPATFEQDYTKYGPGLQLNYLILNFGGGRQAAVEQALQTVYALDFGFNQAIQDVLLNVETAYYNLISAQASIETAQANVDDAKSTLDAAKESLTAGVGTDLDVLQAQAAYDQTLYGLASAEGLVNIARGSFAQTMGLPANVAVQAAAPLQEVPERLMVPDVQHLINDALNRRPDISGLRATLAAKESAVGVAGSPLWPSLYFNGSVRQDSFDTTQTAENRPMQDSDWVYSGGFSLQWTLFDGLQTVNAKRVAQEQAEAARAQLKQAELAASGDVWARYHNYETALKKHEFSTAYLKSAAAAHELAMDSYKAGLKSILDLLNAETQLAQARQQNVAARQEVFTALAQFIHATGLLEKGATQNPGTLFSTSTQKENNP